MQSHSSCNHGYLVIFALVHHLETKRKVLHYLLGYSFDSECSFCTEVSLLSYYPLTHLSLSNMEVLIAVIDDGAVLAAGSDVANTLYKEKH